MNEQTRKTVEAVVFFILKLILAGVILYISLYAGLGLLLLGTVFELVLPLVIACMVLIPALVIPVFFKKIRKPFFRVWCIYLCVLLVGFLVNSLWNAYDESITVNTAPNINVEEYMPFVDDSKIVRLEGEASLRFESRRELPILDGAAAVFPVYSAFVNATYPRVELARNPMQSSPFRYTNTVDGYTSLARKDVDIFFGAYPSQEQIDYAELCNTQYVYTPIGYEAFVFFVHKDNPVDNLTTEQIRGIYSGQITNWSQVGGRNEPIVAYQRNDGSGSQSRLIRFMDGVPLMEPPSEWRMDLMSGIVDVVSQYHSTSSSIGFSFRYYVEGIIQNPDIKLVSIDGIAPTVENIQNGSYPHIEPLYAVTWDGNEKETVQLLLDWILSEEGQYIIEQTGYVPIS